MSKNSAVGESIGSANALGDPQMDCNVQSMSIVGSCGSPANRSRSPVSEFSSIACDSEAITPASVGEAYSFTQSDPDEVMSQGSGVNVVQPNLRRLSTATTVPAGRSHISLEIEVPQEVSITVSLEDERDGRFLFIHSLHWNDAHALVQRRDSEAATDVDDLLAHCFAAAEYSQQGRIDAVEVEWFAILGMIEDVVRSRDDPQTEDWRYYARKFIQLEAALEDFFQGNPSLINSFLAAAGFSGPTILP